MVQAMFCELHVCVHVHTYSHTHNTHSIVEGHRSHGRSVLLKVLTLDREKHPMLISFKLSKPQVLWEGVGHT